MSFHVCHMSNYLIISSCFCLSVELVNKIIYVRTAEPLTPLKTVILSQFILYVCMLTYVCFVDLFILYLTMWFVFSQTMFGPHGERDDTDESARKGLHLQESLQTRRRPPGVPVPFEEMVLR